MAKNALTVLAVATGLWAVCLPARAEEIATSAPAGAGVATWLVAEDPAVYGEIAPTEVSHGRLGAGRKASPEETAPSGEKPGAFDVAASLAVVSDYWARGLSVSAGKPAFQPSIGIAHRSGFHASLWGSNVADNGGDNSELDAGFGFAHRFGAVNADLGVIEYIYPGAGSANYLELQAALETRAGAATLKAAVAYVPGQGSTGGTDSIYYETAFDLPVGKTPLSLFGAAGLEDGFFGDNRISWQLGATYGLGTFDFGLSYADAARSFGEPNSGPRVIVSIEKKF